MGQSPSNAGGKSFGEALKKSFNIKSQIIQVERFANKMIKYFFEMIGKIIKYTRKFIFSSFKFSKIVWFFSSLILFGIILFSKNRYADLLVLAYFFMIFVTIQCILIFILLFLIVLGMIIDNIKYWIKLDKELRGKDPPKMNGKKIWQIIKHIFILIFIFIMIVILGFVSYLPKISLITQGVLFDTINTLYEKDAKAELAALKESASSGRGGETFGEILKKILDKCG